MHPRAAVLPRLLVALFLSAALLAPAAAANKADNVPASGLPKAAAESVGMSTERLARIAPVMQEYVDAEKVPGVISMVARKGKLVHFESVGHMDMENQVAMGPDTILRMYSQSKPVTAAAVMILYEEGKFLLTDPVSDYLPALKDLRVLVDHGTTEPARPMNIKHLLTHTSGLSYSFMPGTVGKMYEEAGLLGSDDGTPITSLEEYVEKLGEMPLVAQPGTLWHYSIGMDVLGRLVEVWSGQPFDEFLEERIFAPLGMGDTAFYVKEGQGDRLANNYAWNPESNSLVLFDERSQSRFHKKPNLPMGGSGLVSTASDYLRFAQMLVNGGELDGVRVLSRKSVELMTADHLGPEYGPAPVNLGGTVGEEQGARGLGFGFSGSVVTDPAHTHSLGSVGSYSWGGAAYTNFWIDPQEELVGMVLTQVMGCPHPLREKMIVLTYGAFDD